MSGRKVSEIVMDELLFEPCLTCKKKFRREDMCSDINGWYCVNCFVLVSQHC